VLVLEALVEVRGIRLVAVHPRAERLIAAVLADGELDLHALVERQGEKALGCREDRVDLAARHPVPGKIEEARAFACPSDLPRHSALAVAVV
jgi:hypothetical protein